MFVNDHNLSRMYPDSKTSLRYKVRKMQNMNTIIDNELAEATKTLELLLEIHKYLESDLSNLNRTELFEKDKEEFSKLQV